MCTLMWVLYVNCSSSIIKHINLQCGRHIWLGAYDNNVKYMYTNAPTTIVCSSKLI